jgi:hypothetical protein
MSDQDEPTEEWPGLEVAIEGTNLSPADVNARHLIELVEAALGALEAVAEDRGAKKVDPPRLVKIRKGSAAYDLRTPDESISPVIDELARHVASRGAESSPSVRRAIDRLHRAGKTGSVRMRTLGSRGRASGQPIYVAPTLRLVHAPFETATEVYAKVVSVSAGKLDNLSVKLRLDDGGTAEFDADQSVAAIAGRLFLQSVRAEVEYEVTGDSEKAGTITSIEAFAPVRDDEILDEFERIRGDLASHGLKVRASDWLKELDE